MTQSVHKEAGVTINAFSLAPESISSTLSNPHAYSSSFSYSSIVLESSADNFEDENEEEGRGEVRCSAEYRTGVFAISSDSPSSQGAQHPAGPTRIPCSSSARESHGRVATARR
jgi:hypothetical protein